MLHLSQSYFDDLALKLELELLLGNHAVFRRRLRQALRQAGLQSSAKGVSKRQRQHLEPSYDDRF